MQQNSENTDEHYENYVRLLTDYGPMYNATHPLSLKVTMAQLEMSQLVDEYN